MQLDTPEPADLDPQDRAFYGAALDMLAAAGVPVLVGGAYAYGHYTGVTRHTKDFDLFIHPRDVQRALAAAAADGYETELTSAVWIGKIFKGEAFVDLIFSAANGIATVDEAWFAHAPAGEIFERTVRFCPAEEIIWSKSFVMERHRYDGADIAHLVRAHGAHMDWARLVQRFAGHWRVLLSHLVLFGFIYPAERDVVPASVLRDLLGRVEGEIAGPPGERVCRGTLFSRTQYRKDTEEWGYRDGRLPPDGCLTADEITELTETAKP
jgi:hypothetical protein